MRRSLFQLKWRRRMETIGFCDGFTPEAEEEREEYERECREAYGARVN